MESHILIRLGRQPSSFVRPVAWTAHMDQAASLTVKPGRPMAKHWGAAVVSARRLHQEHCGSTHSPLSTDQPLG